MRLDDYGGGERQPCRKGSEVRHAIGQFLQRIDCFHLKNGHASQENDRFRPQIGQSVQRVDHFDHETGRIGQEIDRLRHDIDRQLLIWTPTPLTLEGATSTSGRTIKVVSL